MPLKIEQPFDPEALGLSKASKHPSSSSRAVHGLSRGYSSADWAPEEVAGRNEVIVTGRPRSRGDNPIEQAQDCSLSIVPGRASSTGLGKPKFKLKLARLPHLRPYRLAIRPVLRNQSTLSPTRSPPPPTPCRPRPPQPAQEWPSASIADRISKFRDESDASGKPLPNTLRDFFASLDDLHATIDLANDLRDRLGLERIRIGKDNRVSLIRTVSRTRDAIYSILFAALLLPAAQRSAIPEEDVKPEKIITLTPNNLDLLSRRLPASFPRDKKAIRAFMAHPYGELSGNVLWEGGVGRMTGTEGGFRGKISDGDTHIFVDHSNILYGLLNRLYSSTSTALPPRHRRTISLPALSLLLRRGRPSPPGTLHLVASSPLRQDLDSLVRLGWEVSVLKRIELFADEVEDPDALNLTAKATTKVFADGKGLNRFKEQGVDEILHLKLLQTLNTRGDGTIVLATGDARGGQFNRDGFVGAIREALKRGWTVELWSFSAGLSRGWREVAKREKWFDRGFEIFDMDPWAEYLVEVTPS